MAQPVADVQLRRVRRERDRFLGFAFAAGSMLVEVRADDTIGFAAGAIQTYTGAAPEDLNGQPFASLIAKRDRAAVATALERLRRRGRIAPLALHLVGTEQSGPGMIMSGCRLPQSRGLVHLSLRSAAPGEAVPERDASSGLLDPESFERAVREQVGRAGAESDQILTFLRLDGLGVLRSRLDDQEAAELPRRIGGLLQEAGREGTAGRVGEDRFGILHDRQLDVAHLEEELAAFTRSIDPAREGVGTVAVSMPLEVGELSSEDAQKAVIYAIKRFADRSHADFSLHTLRDGFAAMLKDTVVRIGRYRDLLTAEGLELNFQPIVSLRDRRVHHYEALSRVADGGSPAGLVDFAEAIDLVAELDLLVCRRVLTLLERDRPGRGIAVNVSGRSLESDLFKAALLELVNGAAPAARRHLLFELTETAEVRDHAAANRLVQTLRERGCRVGLDDFGAGASTFHYIRAFRCDFVKLDGSLVQSEAYQDRAILRSAVGLCRDLRIATIAEMVETPKQLTRLQELKVDYGQGYLFGKPGPCLAA